MSSLKFEVLPAPAPLQREVECFTIISSSITTGQAIHVAPGSVPGLVFQHRNGVSAIEGITTGAKGHISVPPLFLYGPGVEPSVMHYNSGTYTTIQVVLKPQALHTLFGMNAATLTDGFMAHRDFATPFLDEQLYEARDPYAQVALMGKFLVSCLKHEQRRDHLVEESLRLINRHITGISVNQLIAQLHLSERQFERRFMQVVGVTPQSYIRVQRFHEAVRLIKGGSYQRLTDIAHALNYYDQSHFIRDVKAFAGLTPKKLSRKKDDYTQTGYSFVTG